MENIFDSMLEKWPSALVAAPEVKKFTGGVISGKTLANMASRGESVPDSVRIGNRKAYVATSLIEWLRSRSTPVNPRRVS